LALFTKIDYFGCNTQYEVQCVFRIQNGVIVVLFSTDRHLEVLFVVPMSC